jgi:hypothetical protein
MEEMMLPIASTFHSILTVQKYPNLNSSFFRAGLITIPTCAASSNPEMQVHQVSMDGDLLACVILWYIPEAN